MFALDMHNHQFRGRHNIEITRSAQVYHDACHRRLGLEAAYPDLKHVPAMHRDVAD
jgi:hypothetical protein